MQSPEPAGHKKNMQAIHKRFYDTFNVKNPEYEK